MAGVMAGLGSLRGCRANSMISVYLVVSVILQDVVPPQAKGHLGVRFVGLLSLM